MGYVLIFGIEFVAAFILARFGAIMSGIFAFIFPTVGGLMAIVIYASLTGSLWSGIVTVMVLAGGWATGKSVLAKQRSVHQVHLV